jgi:CBS domain-containing protein
MLLVRMGAASTGSPTRRERAMPIGDYCQEPAATICGAETVRTAAQRMRDEGLGSLAVVVEGRPVGIVTDRDLVLETLGHRLDPGCVKVEEIASKPLVSIDQNAPVREAVRIIRRHAIRRLPVVDDDGELVGIVAADDLFSLAAAELGGLATAVRSQSPSAAPGRRVS